MNTPIIAFGIGSASLYGLYSGIKGLNKVKTKKKELSENTIDYKNISILQPYVNRLVYTTVTSDSGLLELYKIKYKTKINYVELNNSKVFVINPNVATKKYVFSQLLKPDFGLSNYEPNQNRSSYLLNKAVIEKSESDGNSISSYISTKYGLEKMLLNPSSKYLSIFYPLKNKTVYLYGYKNSSEIFSSEIIGLDKEQIIDTVYATEDFNNWSKIIISICALTIVVVPIAKL